MTSVSFSGLDREQTFNESIFPTKHTPIILTDLGDLQRQLSLPDSVVNLGQKAAESYPLMIPATLLDRIEKGNSNDPVLLQFLPRNIELETNEGFSLDPLAESGTSDHCLLQKYQHRVLVLTTPCCEGHCRYCFRRHTRNANALISHPADPISPDRLRKCFAPVELNDTIREVIFSGGDPLSTSNENLHSLLNYIKNLPHVNRVRFHTRLPILRPDRIDDSLLYILREGQRFGTKKLKFYCVFQINHPNELNDNVRDMFDRLAATGTILLSQSVLLRGINDQTEILARLFESLADSGVIPYYLHQLDRVQGAAHFEVSEEKGCQLMQELATLLPGYALPRYVREIPGQPCKKEVSCPLF